MIGRSGLTRQQLEEAASRLGRTIGEVIPEGTGFMFLLFDFGADGNLAYISNAKRQDMIKTLEETIEKLKAN